MTSPRENRKREKKKKENKERKRERERKCQAEELSDTNVSYTCTCLMADKPKFLRNTCTHTACMLYTAEKHQKQQ